MMRDGEIAPIVVVRDGVRAGPGAGLPALVHGPRHRRARARDDTHGRALEVAPLRQRRDGRLTHVNEALTEYEWEGQRGTGISEYLTANAACGKPRRVTRWRGSVSATAAAADIHTRPAELLRDLIRFDTTNPPGNERACISYIEGLLSAAGIESDDPGARPRAAEPDRAAAGARRGSAAPAPGPRRRRHAPPGRTGPIRRSTAGRGTTAASGAAARST